MNKIRLIADRETSFIYHMLSVARCGYDNEYGAKYRGRYSREDLATLKRHESLITCAGGEHWGRLYYLLICLPASEWNGTAKSFYREIIRQADEGEVPEYYLDIAPAAREIADVMARNYDRYAEKIWPEDRDVIETHIAAVTPLFEERGFTDRAEETVGCAFEKDAFNAVMVPSVLHGAEAIDISADRDVFGIDRSPEDSFRFIAHEFIIYLLKQALRDEDAFRRFETWGKTEGLAEYYLKKLTGSVFFADRDNWAGFYEMCAGSETLSAADLYRKGSGIRDVVEENMRIAIREAEEAKMNGENPFGAVLLDKEYRLCHKARSATREMSDPTAHAEVRVIREYCAEHKMPLLEDHILVCSGEPCVMCSGAIRWAGIGQVYYSVPQREINRLSGGKPKPSCDGLINSGTKQRLIVGNVLLKEGLKVFDGFRFVPPEGSGT